MLMCSSDFYDTILFIPLYIYGYFGTKIQLDCNYFGKTKLVKM